jgi:RNA polymerase-binding transcription factor DksA
MHVRWAMDDTDEPVRRRLLLLRDALLLRCHDALEDAAASLQSADGMIAAEYWGARVLSVIGDEAEELRDVIAAINRLDDGRYGRCRVCGDSIGELLLAAFPAADRCSDCAVTKVMPAMTDAAAAANASAEL